MCRPEHAPARHGHLAHCHVKGRARLERGPVVVVSCVSANAWAGQASERMVGG